MSLRRSIEDSGTRWRSIQRREKKAGRRRNGREDEK